MPRIRLPVSPVRPSRTSRVPAVGAEPGDGLVGGPGPGAELTERVGAAPVGEVEQALLGCSRCRVWTTSSTGYPSFCTTLPTSSSWLASRPVI